LNKTSIFSQEKSLSKFTLTRRDIIDRNGILISRNINSHHAAVIPKFISQFMAGESPIINGDGEYSRDFTYIDNVIQANILSMLSENKEAINTVYNVAFGERNTLNDLITYLKESLSEFDPKIKDIQVAYGPNRVGDIPHSLASIDKAKNLLNYNPQFSLQKGLKEAVSWYWKNL
jgi:UDP-N-acetylglucosamine 4-epimerase